MCTQYAKQMLAFRIDTHHSARSATNATMNITRVCYDLRWAHAACVRVCLSVSVSVLVSMFLQPYVWHISRMRWRALHTGRASRTPLRREWFEPAAMCCH